MKPPDLRKMDETALKELLELFGKGSGKGMMLSAILDESLLALAENRETRELEFKMVSVPLEEALGRF